MARYSSVAIGALLSLAFAASASASASVAATGETAAAAPMMPKKEAKTAPTYKKQRDLQSSGTYTFDHDLEGHFYTYPHASGNRVVNNQGTFPSNVHAYDVLLPGKITWVVATHAPTSGYTFVAITEDNKAYSVHPPMEEGQNGKVNELLNFDTVGEQPPIVKDVGDIPVVISLPNADVSPLSHPIPCGYSTYCFIDNQGDFIIWDTFGGQLNRLEDVFALPDGRIARAETGGPTILMSFYADLTDYKEGCNLGDCLEAKRLLIVKYDPQANVIDLVGDVRLPGERVFEGLSPMFLPVSNDIVTTVSDPTEGTMLRMYNATGWDLSQTPAIWQNWDNWRHQLFYNDFGPEGVTIPYFVELMSPSVEKVLKFHDVGKIKEDWLQENNIDVSPDFNYWKEVASLQGYSTHQADTRVLDTSVSGDFNGDGMNEAVVPSDDLMDIAGIQITIDDQFAVEAEEVWRVGLPGPLTSNLAVVDSTSEWTGIAMAGASDQILRMWTPMSDVVSDGTVAATEPFQTGLPPHLQDPPALANTAATDSPTSEPTAEPTAEPTVGEPVGSWGIPEWTLPPTGSWGMPEWTLSPTKKPTFPMRLKPTAKPTYGALDTRYDDSYDGPTYEPTNEPVQKPKPARPVGPPTLSTFDKEKAMGEEMEMQMEEMFNQLESEEAANERKSTIITGTVSAICVVAVGILAFVIGRRYSSRKTMDTADNKNVPSTPTSSVNTSSDLHLNEDEEEGDGSMTNVQLDRQVI